LVVEDCNLRDEDLEVIPSPKQSMKLLSLRSNVLSNPWSILAENFPNLTHLNVMMNPQLNFSADCMVLSKRLLWCVKFDFGDGAWSEEGSKLDESFDEFLSPAVVLEADELTEESKLIYAYNLAINYGLSAQTLETLNDLLRLWTGGEHYKNVWNSVLLLFRHEYRYSIHYYCRRCDAFLPSRFSVCTTSSCPLQNVKCKRSKEMKRTSVHTVAIRPQLETVLRRGLDDLIAAHQAHHAGQPCPSKSETFHFAAYTDDIESQDAFLRGDIHVILTVNFDGVTFKKLSRAEAWPLYLRLEGLQLELRQLEEAPLVMSDRTGRPWRCVVKLSHAIMDMAAIRVLYKSPKWGSLYGCHLCRQRGERDGRRVLWHLPLASHHDHRTRQNILHDAEAKEYGLAGICVLDSLGLGHDDLRRPVEDLIQLNLFRGEVRQWTMVSDKLIPRQKRRRIFEEVGNRSQDSQGSHDELSEGISVASVEL
uniref:Roc domain-containing protein n=1 Tax=Heligmosomoides polygyrus TaxID=6339 RepID=A0A183GWT3_HELPZ